MCYLNEKEGRTTRNKKKWTKGKCYIITLTQRELSEHIQAAARSSYCFELYRRASPVPAPTFPLFTAD